MTKISLPSTAETYNFEKIQELRRNSAKPNKNDLSSSLSFIIEEKIKTETKRKHRGRNVAF